VDAPLKRLRPAIAATAFAPLLPQVFGSAFNIWYNVAIIVPLLRTPALKQRFFDTVTLYNTTIYPLAVIVWLALIFSLRGPFRELAAGREIEHQRLTRLRRRVINLPWWGALLSAVGWLLCIPVFLLSLTSAGEPFDRSLFFHLPVSILVSAVIAMTHSFFLVEVASLWGLFPVFFRDARADTTPGAWVLSLRGRGVLWAVSAGIAPIGSLLLLDFAPPAVAIDHRWFAVFVGGIGIVFGLATAWLISRLVAHPVDQLRRGVQAVAQGDLDAHVDAPRADEFGTLIAEFNRMTGQLREKERLRQTFGLHVGQAAAEQILARDPGLGGVEQVITVMFVDIRGFTARSAASTAPQTVRELNEFLRVMVHEVQDRQRGMINKYLGDGFMALFGIGEEQDDHADRAVAAAFGMLTALDQMNAVLASEGRAPLRIGIGLHSGAAIVGSIGSPERLEFTAIGSTVNLAARIEQLTKQLGTSVLLSGATAERLKDTSDLIELAPQAIRGVEDSVPLFTLFGTNR
jgi:adenylate cyclase